MNASTSIKYYNPQLLALHIQLLLAPQTRGILFAQLLAGSCSRLVVQGSSPATASSLQTTLAACCKIHCWTCGSRKAQVFFIEDLVFTTAATYRLALSAQQVSIIMRQTFDPRYLTEKHSQGESTRTVPMSKPITSISGLTRPSQHHHEPFRSSPSTAIQLDFHPAVRFISEVLLHPKDSQIPKLPTCFHPALAASSY